MDKSDESESKKSKENDEIEEIHEDVAEDVLSQSKPVGVLDDSQKVIGVVYSSKVLSVLFGKRGSNEYKNM